MQKLHPTDSKSTLDSLHAHGLTWKLLISDVFSGLEFY